MNTETKESISRALEILRGHLNAIEANRVLINHGKAIAAQLDGRRVNIEATGQNAAGLPSLTAEIVRNNEHITRLEVRHQELCLALNNDLEPIYPQAQAILRQVYSDNVAAAITRVRPLVGTDKEAQIEGEKSAECLAVRRALTTLGAGPWDRAESHARIIVQYFESASQGA